MVTDEEMKFRDILRQQSGPHNDESMLMDLAAKMQGTNMESYPERYISPRAQINMNDPKKFNSGTGMPNDILRAMSGGGVYGVAGPSGRSYFIPDKNADFTFGHEMEHVGQHFKHPQRKGFDKFYGDRDVGLAKMMMGQIEKEKGWFADAPWEFLAHLSGMEATAPVGSSWKDQTKWPDMSEKEFKELDARRRPDMRNPLSPLPKPDVQQYGYTGEPPTIMQRLLRGFK